MLVGDLDDDRLHCGVGEAVPGVRGVPRRSVYGGAVLDGGVDGLELREIDVERVPNASGPQARVVHAGRRTGLTVENERAGRVVVAGVVAGESMKLESLPARGVGLAERDAVGQALELSAVKMDLDLVSRFGMEAVLDIGTGNGRVDIHDEDGAVVAWKDVEVVDVELAVLPRERGVEMMGHAVAPLGRDRLTNVSNGRSTFPEKRYSLGSGASPRAGACSRPRRARLNRRA